MAGTPPRVAQEHRHAKAALLLEVAAACLLRLWGLWGLLRLGSKGYWVCLGFN